MATSSQPRRAPKQNAKQTGRKPAAPRGLAPKPLPGKSMAATKAIVAAEKKAGRAATAGGAKSKKSAGGSGVKRTAGEGALKRTGATSGGLKRTGVQPTGVKRAGVKRAGSSASGMQRGSGGGGRGGPARGFSHGGAPAHREHPARRQRARRTEANDELIRMAGKQSRRVVELLGEATEAFVAGRERDALRMLRPMADRYPDAIGVRELVGLCHYRIGNFKAATKELELVHKLSGSTDQHPVLMDCYRAQRLWKKVDESWRELAETSPSAELVTEGRIVMAGSLSDRGRRDEAITLLEKRNAKAPRRVQAHHARLWYALGDLHERAGNHPRARALFIQVSKYDAQFADVAERLANLQ